MAQRPLEIAIDHHNETIEIQGIKYAFSLFDALALGPTGARFEIVSRQDGVVTLRTLHKGKADG